MPIVCLARSPAEVDRCWLQEEGTAFALQSPDILLVCYRNLHQRSEATSKLGSVQGTSSFGSPPMLCNIVTKMPKKLLSPVCYSSLYKSFSPSTFPGASLVDLSFALLAAGDPLRCNGLGSMTCTGSIPTVNPPPTCNHHHIVRVSP